MRTFLGNVLFFRFGFVPHFLHLALLCCVRVAPHRPPYPGTRMHVVRTAGMPAPQASCLAWPSPRACLPLSPSPAPDIPACVSERYGSVEQPTAPVLDLRRLWYRVAGRTALDGSTGSRLPRYTTSGAWCEPSCIRITGSQSLSAAGVLGAQYALVSPPRTAERSQTPHRKGRSAIKYHPQSGWFDEGPQRGPARL